MRSRTGELDNSNNKKDFAHLHILIAPELKLRLQHRVLEEQTDVTRKLEELIKDYLAKSEKVRKRV